MPTVGAWCIVATPRDGSQYLYNTDKDKYFEVIKANNIRDKMSVVEVTKA